MMKAKEKLILLVFVVDGSKTSYSLRAPVLLLLYVLSSSVQDANELKILNFCKIRNPKELGKKMT